MMPPDPAIKPAPAAPPSQEPRRGLAYPRVVESLISEFGRLPGIGRRTAERLALHILRSDAATAKQLAHALLEVKRTVRSCSICWNLSDGARCVVCDDPARDASQILVVEQPKDLIAIEQTRMYKGVYHVLTGRLSPLEGVGPGDLTIASLIERAQTPGANPRNTAAREIILGLNPTLEGDGTALYLHDALRSLPGVRVSRLARGLASGASIEHASKQVLADALQGRQAIADEA
jgi:recombination protein RecR